MCSFLFCYNIRFLEMRKSEPDMTEVKMLRTWVREWVEEDLIHLAVGLVGDNNIHSTLREEDFLVDLVVFSFNLREVSSFN